jgi:hypothetical protein
MDWMIMLSERPGVNFTCPEGGGGGGGEGP